MRFIKKVEKIRMGLSGGLATQHPIKFLGMLALATIMMAGAALHLGPNSADEVGTASPDIVIGKFDTLPDDAWRSDSPYYDDFQSESGHPALRERATEYPGDDEWVFGSPYIQMFPEDDPYAYLTPEEFASVMGHGKAGGTDMGVLPEDDPYAYLTMDEFDRVATARNAQKPDWWVIPDDQWIFGSPYLDDFSVDPGANSSPSIVLQEDDPYADLTPEERARQTEE